MRKQQKSILLLGIITAFVATGFFLPKLIGAGQLEPVAPPGPTMKTLDEIPPTWSQILPADDGPDSCNSSRFKCVMGGEAVLDKQTGLTWARNANILGTRTWYVAMKMCYGSPGGITIANQKGWRLPTVNELASLLDMSQSGPPYLPFGHPFLNVQTQMTDIYWSITEYAADPAFPPTNYAWVVNFCTGGVHAYNKTYGDYACAWPVRGGN